MNNDLISRSALIDALPIVTKDRKVSLFGVVFDFVDMICNAPTVDAVEVCRCKDCKHRRNDEDYASGHYCVKRPSNGGYFCEDNDFCSYGERKGDDAELN